MAPVQRQAAREGEYECAVLLTSLQRNLISWNLYWDGVGFRTPCPMVVVKWRGLTKRAHDAAIAAEIDRRAKEAA